jgi:hypothetical protein
MGWGARCCVGDGRHSEVCVPPPPSLPVPRYYRHFRLYTFVLAPRPAMQLTQCSDNLVDAPPTAKPLSQALPE